MYDGCVLFSSDAKFSAAKLLLLSLAHAIRSIKEEAPASCRLTLDDMELSRAS